MLAAVVILSGCVIAPHPIGHGDPGGHRHHRGGDRDRDGIPNRHDRDRDGDGVRNRNDRNPDNPNRY